MKTVDLFLFLSSFTIAVGYFAVIRALCRREGSRVAAALLTVILIPINAYVGFRIDPNLDYLGLLGHLMRERDLSSVVALAMGIAAAIPWWRENCQNRSARESGLLVFSAILIVVGGQAFLWKDVYGYTRHPVAMLKPGFELQEIAQLDEQPLRLAVDGQGALFICYDYYKKHGAIGGAILKLQPDDQGGCSQRTVVEAPFLIRPYGLAVRDGDLFVSRAGFLPRARAGSISYDHSGAITQLKDLDGDGYFEFADDVVTDLPGMRAPDTMQQNNGLVFTPDGRLLVTNASAADRTLDEHPWGGTILEFSPDFSHSEIFARGFRNPWGIALGPDGEVFATDNDVDINPGDEINHVVRGGHYGHPFVIPNEKDVTSVGFRDPILVGELETVFLGITYATSPALPAEFRNCLYVTDFRQNRVLRLRLEKTSDTFRVVSVEPFASIPTPVDIASTESGEFYVISRRAQTVYRIRPQQSARQ